MSLKEHNRELTNAFRLAIESKENYHVWSNMELSIEINKQIKGHFKIIKNNVCDVIIMQKYYRTFKSLGRGCIISYIFVPRFKSVEGCGLNG